MEEKGGGCLPASRAKRQEARLERIIHQRPSCGDSNAPAIATAEVELNHDHDIEGQKKSSAPSRENNVDGSNGTSLPDRQRRQDRLGCSGDDVNESSRVDSLSIKTSSPTLPGAYPSTPVFDGPTDIEPDSSVLTIREPIQSENFIPLGFHNLGDIAVAVEVIDTEQNRDIGEGRNNEALVDNDTDAEVTLNAAVNDRKPSSMRSDEGGAARHCSRMKLVFLALFIIAVVVVIVVLVTMNVKSGSGKASAAVSPPMPASSPVAAPIVFTPPNMTLQRDDSRMVAFMANWQACPTPAQLEQYTHVAISFAVSYSYNETKNNYSLICEIEAPAVCSDLPNPQLIAKLQASGTKVLLSFGGAGMGGSWEGDNNNCWDYCFTREEEVANRLAQIVNDMGLDGVNLNYEYYYEDDQYGSDFALGTQAQNFLRGVTMALRSNLPAGAQIVHTVQESDATPGTVYFDILKDLSGVIDYVMLEYYNDYSRPALDGFNGIGVGSVNAAAHYGSIVTDIFAGDASKVVFGFCISDCSDTKSNANAKQARQVMGDLSTSYPCNGGAFFWVAAHDVKGEWSGTVNQVVQPNAGCSNE